MFTEYIEDMVSDYYDDIYKNMINNTAQLCHELKVHDQISIFVIFNYLLWNGFFSESKDYYFSPEKSIICTDNLAYSIMTNYGICINNAHILSDILKKLQYNVTVIEGYLCPKIKLDYKTHIKAKEIDEQEINLKDRIIEFLIKNTNHVCVLNLNKPYLLDPTNNCLYSILDRNAYVVSGKGYFKPTINKTTPMYIKRALEENSKEIKNINIGEYFKENVDLCDANKKLLDDFYNENYDNIKRIAKYVKKVK